MTFGAGGFLCSLSNKELAEFHHFLEKDFPFQEPGRVKHAIICAGRQPEGGWMLNRHLIIDGNGVQIPEASAMFAWPPIGGPCMELAGKGQRSIDLQCDISLPLQSSPCLSDLLKLMQKIFKHNFISSIKTV